MDANSVERAMRHIPGVAEGGKNEGSHSSAGLWKPKDDDQLRALAASGESSFEIGRLLHRSPAETRPTERRAFGNIDSDAWRTSCD